MFMWGNALRRTASFVQGEVFRGAIQTFVNSYKIDHLNLTNNPPSYAHKLCMTDQAAII